MTTSELKKRLIGEINQTENREILEEMYRLIVNEESQNSFYKLSFDQKSAVEEAWEQFKNRQIIHADQADKEIDEWLGK